MSGSSYMITYPKQVFCGPGSTNNLKTILSPGMHVLLLTNAYLVEVGILDGIFAILNELGATYSLIENVPVEPYATQAQEIVDSACSMTCDMVLAVGGGSVLDTAKLVATLADKTVTVSDLLTEPLKAKQRDKMLVMIPTTAGTGSEATINAIVTEQKQKVKIGIVNPVFMPDYVILDPELTTTLPKEITASTGMDALCHAMECFISLKGNPFSDMFALRAMRLIFDNIITAYEEPKNIDARHAMLFASFLGGLSISTSSTTAVHALSYPLGGRYRIPHGVSNAMLLPYVMEFNKNVITAKLHEIATCCMHQPESIGEEAAADLVIKKLYTLVDTLNIPASLKDFNITSENLDAIVKEALGVKRLLGNNPKPMNYEDVKTIYQRLL